MKRKNFIYLSIGSAMAIATTSIYCRNPDKTLHRTLARPEFLSSICNTVTVGEIGAAYLEMFPSEKKQDQLADLLLADSTGQSIPKTADLPLQLHQNITEDFNRGKTVIINGWVLSQTEARQCALFYLAEN
jgi:hypothetical protein